MNTVIFLGSPRPGRNTAKLTAPFARELESLGGAVHVMDLSDKDIQPCKGCYACQNVQDAYGCVQKDDMQAAVERIRWADLIVLATPIYTWYCPGTMKNLLDRHYGLNKFYGRATGSLWAGKAVAILATHGYERDYACGPFETGVLRLCEHSKLVYLGLCSAVDRDDTGFVLTEAIEAEVRDFARKLAGALAAE